jgi:hypothetical protein
MKSAFERDDLMTILDGIDDAVVKLDGQAKFHSDEPSGGESISPAGVRPPAQKDRAGPGVGARSLHSHTASGTPELTNSKFPII